MSQVVLTTREPWKTHTVPHSGVPPSNFFTHLRPAMCPSGPCSHFRLTPKENESMGPTTSNCTSPSSIVSPMTSAARISCDDVTRAEPRSVPNVPGSGAHFACFFPGMHDTLGRAEGASMVKNVPSRGSFTVNVSVRTFTDAPVLSSGRKSHAVNTRSDPSTVVRQQLTLPREDVCRTLQGRAEGALGSGHARLSVNMVISHGFPTINSSPSTRIESPSLSSDRKSTVVRIIGEPRSRDAVPGRGAHVEGSVCAATFLAWQQSAESEGKGTVMVSVSLSRGDVTEDTKGVPLAPHVMLMVSPSAISVRMSHLVRTSKESLITSTHPQRGTPSVRLIGCSALRLHVVAPAGALGSLARTVRASPVLLGEATVSFRFI